MRTPYPARLARLAAGKTKPQACKAGRISLSTLNKLECGFPASLRVMRALARFYGCASDFPFRRHRPPPPKGGRSVARKPGTRAAASPAVEAR